jgi:hypothetical protein
VGAVSYSISRTLCRRDLWADADISLEIRCNKDAFAGMIRQPDQARSDFAAIEDELNFVKHQLGRLPTRGDLACMALGVIFGTVGLVIFDRGLLAIAHPDQ